MNTLNQHKVAVTVGLFLGGWHVVWSLLVALGIGQALYDFILWAHMIHLPVVIGPFDIAASAVLIVVTSCIGYIFGWAFAFLWNWLHRGM
jgi:hypothetical protein